MPDIAACLIYSTHPSLEQARATASQLLDERLAACCNILPGMESHYSWQGKREVAGEVVMFSKTTAAFSTKAMALIRAQHPYENPAILVLQVRGGDADFLRWIAQSCA